jgi:3-oxoacyl-[acyl-carrier protein] reductase
MPIVNYPFEEGRQIIRVNIDGAFFALKCILQGMKGRGYSRIVNIASIAGKEGDPNASAHSASNGFDRADEIGGKGGGRPGHSGQLHHFRRGEASHIYLARWARRTSATCFPRSRGRFLKTAEAAAMITWLLTTEDSFSTGAVFDLSGRPATY